MAFALLPAVNSVLLRSVQVLKLLPHPLPVICPTFIFGTVNHGLDVVNGLIPEVLNQTVHSLLKLSFLILAQAKHQLLRRFLSVNLELLGEVIKRGLSRHFLHRLNGGGNHVGGLLVVAALHQPSLHRSFG